MQLSTDACAVTKKCIPCSIVTELMLSNIRLKALVAWLAHWYKDLSVILLLIAAALMPNHV